jgi:diguanylate cyclase (GGDEF)-like protein/putative nucleotidyltransferase with HDIG domain
LLADRAERTSEVADLVMMDAGLTLGILSDANRTIAPTGLGITSVSIALEILGRESLRDRVTALMAGPVLANDAPALQLYRHSLVASLAAESLARVIGSVSPEKARVAGLLHDVGAWYAEVGHDRDAVHARLGARILRRAGIPDEICHAVASHHDPPDAAASDRAAELAGVLTMADRVATALCIGDADGVHSPNVEEGILPRLSALAKLATDRAAREVSDNMIVLGTLLGVSSLTLDTVMDACCRLVEGEPDAPPPPTGLAPEVRRGVEAVRQSAHEPEAMRVLMRVVRSAPGVKSALLVLEEAGEAMLEGHPDNRPFFLRARDITRACEAFPEFLARAVARGPSIVRGGDADDATLAAFKARTMLAVPVKAAATFVGIVLVPDPTDEVTQGTADSLGVVARAAGDALESLQLARGSYLLSEKIATDALTGVLNRGPFFERFSAEVRAANRYRRPLAFAMIDVDGFKGWNDRYGHQVGDRLLRDVSKTIRDCAREGDIVGRYGGDEFSVLLPGCTSEQASAFAERVRERVQALGSILRESCYELSLSVSIGVASTTTWPCESEVLLFRADHALYRAKERGRNRVCADQS